TEMIIEKLLDYEKLPPREELGRVGVCTGCYDILQSGHAVFFEQCKEYCDTLFVVVGRASVVSRQKPGRPINPDNNRLYLVAALDPVDYAVLGDDPLLPGKIDCYTLCERLKPDVYVLNGDDSGLAWKRTFCEERGIELQLVERTVPGFLEATSTTAIVEKIGGPEDRKGYFPSRICVTGGWLDQPWVSEVVPGAVTTLNLEPTRDYAFRSGMATSTREAAKRLWKEFPEGDPETLARILFGAENPPGKFPIAGSQDALGLLMPGFNVLHYDGGFWPTKIESDVSEETAEWFESVLFLKEIDPRPEGYDPLIEKNFTVEAIQPLAESTEMAVQAVKGRDAGLLGKAIRQTLESWKQFLPNTVPDRIHDLVKATDGSCHGCSLSGCGGGYLLMVADRCPEGAIPITVRRRA
ncbi:MAG: adenylyltransferase/cytidyltransferase family protein, partial [Verrucomicrobiota bacterium]